MTDTKTINIFAKSLRDVRIPHSATNAPNALLIRTAHRVAERDDQGNPTGRYTKLVLEGVDVNLAKTLQQQGLGIDRVVPLTVDYIADSDTLASCKPESLIGAILDIRKAEVALKWVTRGNSGNWGEFKLVINQIVKLPANQPERG